MMFGGLTTVTGNEVAVPPEGTGAVAESEKALCVEFGVLVIATWVLVAIAVSVGVSVAAP